MATRKNTAFRVKLDDTTDEIRISENTENGAMLRTPTGIWAHHGGEHVKVYPQVGSGEDVTINNITIEGGINYNIETISSDKTLGASDHVIFVNASVDVDITLPLAASYAGKEYIIRTRKNSNDAHVYRSGSDQIDDGVLIDNIDVNEAKGRTFISDGISTWYCVTGIGS